MFRGNLLMDLNDDGVGLSGHHERFSIKVGNSILDDSVPIHGEMLVFGLDTQVDFFGL